MARMWMIRAEGGRLYEEFRERGVAAIGWWQLAELARPGMSRQQLIDIYRQLEPQAPLGRAINGASQVWRFINEIEIGDSVVTYSPANRTYLIGTIVGQYVYKPEWAEDGMAQVREVQWQATEVGRDQLTQSSKNTLGSTLTVFLIPDLVSQQLLSVAAGSPVATTVEAEVEEAIVDPLAGVETAAIERIKDLVSALGWQDMQELVAGILRAMGYKTQVSPAGPDRGKDIIASPDGFGFENPRIVVEVKHRTGQMGSNAIRSFLGGRHQDDRGLYVSTGGFTKDAYYEAERASVPLTLWTLDNLVRALVEHYDSTDTETKRLVPLKRMYWPA
jgi:restriction system protein